MSIIVIAAILTALALSASAQGHLVARPKGDSLKAREASQMTNLYHAKYVCRHGARQHKSWSCKAQSWLARELAETRQAIRAQRDAAATGSAWAWYQRSDTQCVANHEGGWSSVNRWGYYGRFQMDVAFQRAYGRSFYERWGTANNWPPWAQVQAAYNGYKARGWGPWPTYYRYCT